MQGIRKKFHERVAAPADRPSGSRQEVNGSLEGQINEPDEDLEHLKIAPPVDENLFGNLYAFVTQSNAFKMFRTRLAPGVLPTERRLSEPDDVADSAAQTGKSTDTQGLPSWTGRILEAVLIRTRFVEPPLQPGTVRVRWRCVSHERAE